VEVPQDISWSHIPEVHDDRESGISHYRQSRRNAYSGILSPHFVAFCNLGFVIEFPFPLLREDAVRASI
jgi:hypothetical protein